MMLGDNPLNLVDAATELSSQIAAERPGTYFDAEIPGPLDSAITQLMDGYAKAEGESRLAAAAAFQGSWQSLVLFSYAARMATLAVRLRQLQGVRLALSALAFEGARNDWRDTLVYLAVASDAAERVGLDPVNEIKKAANLASTSEVHERFIEFASRSREVMGLRAMGWRLTGSGTTARYESF
jgi:hypothetical protein